MLLFFQHFFFLFFWGHLAETAWSHQHKPKWAYGWNVTFTRCWSWDMVIVLISRSFTRSHCWESFRCSWWSPRGTNKLCPIFLSHACGHTSASAASPLHLPRHTAFCVHHLSVSCHWERQFCMLHSKSEHTHRNIQILCYLILIIWYNLDWNKN